MLLLSLNLLLFRGGFLWGASISVYCGQILLCSLIYVVYLLPAELSFGGPGGFSFCGSTGEPDVLSAEVGNLPSVEVILCLKHSTPLSL